MTEQYESVIVSSFVLINPERKDKKITDYVKWIDEFLSLNIPKIVFIDSTIIDLFNKEYKYATIVPCNKSELILYEYKNNIDISNIITDNKTKDTVDYFFVQCSKIEWIRKAIEKNNNYNQYIWMDIGIRNICPSISTVEFENLIKNMLTKKYDMIRMPTIWDPSILLNNEYNKNINLEKINWFFAGGIVGGPKHLMIAFSKIMYETVQKLIIEYKTLFWEVNVYILIYKTLSNIFSPYNCDHDISMMVNY